MSNIADSRPVEHESLLNQAEDFGQSALHTALESPINGCIQIIDHAANVHLPELNLIGAPKNDSIGAKAGAVVGAAVDIIGLSIVTGGAADILGAAGTAAGVLTAAATGAIYSGILTPSDANSKHFLADRLTNGAIGAAAFATMNAAAGVLGATGLFAAPAARSLVGSVTFGGLTGAAGGVASAEATAVLKEGKALPSSDELFSSVGRNALFGGAYGGLGFALNQLTGPASRPTEVQSAGAKISTVNDANGRPVAFKAIVPADDDPTNSILWTGSKSTTGSWHSSSQYLDADTGAQGTRANIPAVVGAQIGPYGEVTIATGEASGRVFFPGANYDNNLNLSAEIYEGQMSDAERFFEKTVQGTRLVSTPAGYHSYDAAGHTTAFANGPSSPYTNGALMTYAPDGSLAQVRMTTYLNQPAVELSQTGPGAWKVETGQEIYSWQGEVETIKEPISNEVVGLKFAPREGAPVTYDTASGTQGVIDSLTSTGKFESLLPAMASVQVDQTGSLIIKTGSFQQLLVNGKLASGATSVKPQDTAVLRWNEGERDPDWVNYPITLGKTANGLPTINGQSVPGGKPSSLGDLVGPWASK